jgi:hypothetical protein
LSDERIKKKINTISDDEALRFLGVEPIEFQYKAQTEDDLKYHVGYRAQDLMRAGLTKIVAGSDIPEGEPDLGEDQVIECFDGSKVELSKKRKLVVSLQNSIPYLHKLVARQAKQIDELYKLLETKSDKRAKKNKDD